MRTLRPGANKSAAVKGVLRSSAGRLWRAHRRKRERRANGLPCRGRGNAVGRTRGALPSARAGLVNEGCRGRTAARSSAREPGRPACPGSKAPARAHRSKAAPSLARGRSAYGNNCNPPPAARLPARVQRTGGAQSWMFLLIFLEGPAAGTARHLLACRMSGRARAEPSWLALMPGRPSVGWQGLNSRAPRALASPLLRGAAAPPPRRNSRARASAARPRVAAYSTVCRGLPAINSSSRPKSRRPCVPRRVVPRTRDGRKERVGQNVLRWAPAGRSPAPAGLPDPHCQRARAWNRSSTTTKLCEHASCSRSPGSRRTLPYRASAANKGAETNSVFASHVPSWAWGSSFPYPWDTPSSPLVEDRSSAQLLTAFGIAS
jgi:hypothetical protein